MFDPIAYWMIGSLLLGLCIVSYWGWRSHKDEHANDTWPPKRD